MKVRYIDILIHFKNDIPTKTQLLGVYIEHLVNQATVERIE